MPLVKAHLHAASQLGRSSVSSQQRDYERRLRQSTVSKRSIGQFFAAAGVILSLLFVGYEIRQNNTIARAAAVQGTVEQIIQWQTEAAQDSDWMRILTSLQSGGRYADLSPEDRTRYHYFVQPTIRITENRFRQMQLGIIDQGDLGVAGGTSNPFWFQSQHLLDFWHGSNPT